jgi:hypothetical protein
MNSWPLMRQGIGSAMSFLLFGLFVISETKGVERRTTGYLGPVVSIEKFVLEPSDVQITDF